MAIEELAVPHHEIWLINTKYLKQLGENLRFASFIDGNTNREWVNFLGPDVSGLTHPSVVAEIAQEFMDYNASHGIVLSTEEQTLFLTAAWDHDWGELIIDGEGVGDVDFEQKTQTHERVEMRIFYLLLEQIPEGKAKDTIQRAYTEVAFNRESRLGRMFNAVERIGYLQTAINAAEGKVCQLDGRIENVRIAQWRGMAGSVLSNALETLLEYRKEYPYVKKILQERKNTISWMFETILSTDVPLDRGGNPSYDLAKLQRAHASWRQEIGMASETNRKTLSVSEV